MVSKYKMGYGRESETERFMSCGERMSEQVKAVRSRLAMWGHDAV